MDGFPAIRLTVKTRIYAHISSNLKNPPGYNTTSVHVAVEWQGQLYQVLVGCLKIGTSLGTSQTDRNPHSYAQTIIIYTNLYIHVLIS